MPVTSSPLEAGVAIVKTAVFAWKGMSVEEYWEYTLKALDLGNGLMPYLFLDGGA